MVTELSNLASVTRGLWHHLRCMPAHRGEDKFQIELKPVCEPKSASAPFTFNTAVPENSRTGWGFGHRMVPSVAVVHFSWEFSNWSLIFGSGSMARLLTHFTADDKLLWNVTVLIACVMRDTSYGVAPRSLICFGFLLGWTGVKFVCVAGTECGLVELDRQLMSLSSWEEMQCYLLRTQNTEL